MQSFPIRNLVLAATFVVVSAVSVRAQIVITEIHSNGNDNSTYAADWFELTNTGLSAVNISGWKVDDNSNSFAAAIALTGVVSIAPGQSVVFIEGTASTATAFKSAWFGSSTPFGFAIGTYSGGGIGLSSGSGDALNIYDGSGALKANVIFGGDPTPATTFDNALGLNNTTISAQSVVGVHGAFNSVTGGEIGSPGLIPEPGTYAAVLALTTLAVAAVRRRTMITQAVS